MADFSGTFQPTWIKQEASIETSHGAQVAFNSSGCCPFHPDIQVRKKTVMGGWKTLIAECPRCKIDWEDRVANRRYQDWRFQGTQPNSWEPPPITTPTFTTPASQVDNEDEPLPSNWEVMYDPTTGKPFYVDHERKITQWTRPRPEPQNAQPPATAHSWSPAVDVSVPLSDRAVPSYVKRNNALGDSFHGNVLRSMLGAQEMQAAFLGHHLGWYQCLASAPEPLSAFQLAVQTESSEWYAREWCDHQVLSGWIECADDSVEERRYFMSHEQKDVILGNQDLMGSCDLVAALGGSLGKVKDAFKRDTDVHWNEHDALVHSTFSESSRRSSTESVDIYPRYFPDLHAKWLSSGGRVVFVGSTFGWDEIMFAKSYPTVRISIVCMDQPTLHVIQGNVNEAGLQDQIDAALIGETGEMARCAYEMVYITDVNADPVALLRSAKQLSGGMSTVILSIMANEEFTWDFKMLAAPFQYWISLMLARGSTSFGAFIRPSQLERIVVQAGFWALHLVAKDDESGLSHFIVLQ
jgi:WW domain